MSKRVETQAGCLEMIGTSTFNRDRRVGIRRGMGDAAHLCDAIAADVLARTTKRGGKIPSKKGRMLAAIAKECGDAIWHMREQIKVDDLQERGS
jgi:hypothetical protein